MNVLLDTSVWIKHFRASNLEVVELLEAERVVSHDFVVAELACGSLKRRAETLGYMAALDTLPTLSTEHMLILIESHSLYSRGIGFVDVQLLASTVVTPDTQLWTADKRLDAIASALRVSYTSN